EIEQGDAGRDRAAATAGRLWALRDRWRREFPGGDDRAAGLLPALAGGGGAPPAAGGPPRSPGGWAAGRRSGDRPWLPIQEGDGNRAWRQGGDCERPAAERLGWTADAAADPAGGPPPG